LIDTNTLITAATLMIHKRGTGRKKGKGREARAPPSPPKLDTPIYSENIAIIPNNLLSSTMATKTCEFQYKIGYNSACIRDLTQTRPPVMRF